MKQASQNATVNVPILGLFTLLFVALKLTHVITWSWLWVLAPSWIPLAILVVFILVVGAGALAYALVK